MTVPSLITKARNRANHASQHVSASILAGNPRTMLMLGIAFSAVAVLLLAPDMSLAAGTPADNAKNLLVGWAKALLIGCVGLSAPFLFFKGDIGKAITLVLIAMLLGGFLYAEDTATGVITNLWQTVAGTSGKSSS